MLRTQTQKLKLIMAFQGHPVLGLLVLLDLLTNGIAVSPSHGIAFKDVNTISEAVPVWPPVRYISDTGQYRCTVSGLPLLYIYIYIYMYVCMYVCMCLCIYIL